MGWPLVMMMAPALLMDLPTTAPAAAPGPRITSSRPASRPADPPVPPALPDPADESRHASAPKSAQNPKRAPLRDLFLPYVPADYALPSTTTGEPDITPQSGLVLTGLMVDAGRFQALLEDKEAGRSVFLVVGDRIDPWRVERIELTRLVLEKEDGASLVVELGGTLSASLPPEVAPGATGIGTPPTSRGAAPFDPNKSVEEEMRRRREAERAGT